MTGITVSDVLTHWPLAAPLDIEPIATGTNNRSFLVMSGAESYILRDSGVDGNGERFRFERELLGALATGTLPFAVPSYVRTHFGHTSVEYVRGTEVARFTLFHCIPGRPARFGSAHETLRCGEGLAALSQALDAVRLDPAVPVPATFGNLSSIHPAVPDPAAALPQLFQDHPSGLILATIMSRVEERWRHSTSGWDSQLIHGDFYPANTLIEAGRVAGILDFEFAGTGHRAMDFAIGLAAFSVRTWDNGCAWPMVDAFATGYLQRAPLMREELAATPTLLRMREVTSLIHWLGRMEQNETTRDDLFGRARRLLALDRWLSVHGTRLVERLERIAGS